VPLHSLELLGILFHHSLEPLLLLLNRNPYGFPNKKEIFRKKEKKKRKREKDSLFALPSSKASNVQPASGLEGIAKKEKNKEQRTKRYWFGFAIGNEKI